MKKFITVLFISVIAITGKSQIFLADNGLTASGTGTSKKVSLGGPLLNAQTLIDFGSANTSSNLIIKKGTANYFFIDNAGKVGIGNAAPTAGTALDVTGTTRTTGLIITGLTGILKANGTNALSAGAVSLSSTDVTGTLAVANGGTGATSLTGVLIGNGTSPVTAVSTATGGQFLRRNAANTGYEFATISGGGNALTSNPLSQFAATTSAQLAGVITDETGTGALVYNTSPSLITPNIGTATATGLTINGQATINHSSNAPSLTVSANNDGVSHILLKNINSSFSSAHVGIRFENATGLKTQVVLANSGTAAPSPLGVNTFGIHQLDGDIALAAALGNIDFRTTDLTPASTKMRILNNGTVGIGTLTPNTNAKLDVAGNVFASGKIAVGTTDMAKIGTYSLAVNGDAIFNKAKVKLYGTWPDFVFEENYGLMPLPSLKQYITENKHLPNVPSAREVENDGIDLGSNQKILLQKIEELTLYILEQQKQIDELKTMIKK